MILEYFPQILLIVFGFGLLVGYRWGISHEQEKLSGLISMLKEQDRERRKRDEND